MAPRNLHTHFDETLLAMAAIEDRSGDEWLSRQLRATEDDRYTIAFALKQSLDQLASAVGLETEAESDPDNAGWLLDAARTRLSSMEIVYGSGGWNRWGVRGDGRVLFSKYHERSGDAEKAESLGFETW
jgi:hypothetical protein